MAGPLGHLTGNMMKKWKQHYVELARQTLSLYEDENKGTVLQTIPTEGTEAHLVDQSGKFILVLKPAIASKQRDNVVLSFVTPQERATWADALESHDAIIFRPLLEGELCLSDEKGRKKEPVHALLWKDKLETFKKRGDGKPTKVIKLENGGVVNVVEPCLFYVAHSGDEGVKGHYFLAPSIAAFNPWLATLNQIFLQKHQKVDRTSAREGYLWKANKQLTAWSKRFFILYPDQLVYFKRRYDAQVAVRGPDAIVAGDRPGGVAGSIRIPGGAELGVINSKEDEGFAKARAMPFRDYMFYVAENGDQKGTRQFLLCANDVRDRADWVRIVQTLITAKESTKHTNSLIEGYLQCAQSLAGKKWDKMYFALLPDRVVWYEKRQDEKEAGLVLIDGGAQLRKVVVAGAEHAMVFADSGDETDVTSVLVEFADAAEKRNWVRAWEQNIETKERKVVSSSLLEGYLWKSSPQKMGTWHKRYCIVLADEMRYYRHRRDAYDDKKAGVVPLVGGGVCEMVRAGDETLEQLNNPADKPYIFFVAESGDESGTRRFYFTTDLERARVEWVKAITREVNRKDARVRPDSLKEGYLWKSDSSMRKWNKRYFVLYENPVRLVYYKRRVDAAEDVEAGCVDIKAEVEIEVVDTSDPLYNSERPFAFTVSENGDADTRKFQLVGRDEATVSSWVSSLTDIVSGLTAWVDPTCLREGYLHLLVKNRMTKYFCVLQGEELEYYKGRGDIHNGQKPAGTVALSGLSTVDIVDTTALLSEDSTAEQDAPVSSGRRSVATSAPGAASLLTPDTELGAAHHHKLHSFRMASKPDMDRESTAANLHSEGADKAYKTDHLFRIQMAGRKPVMIAAKHNTERDNWVADILHGILVQDTKVFPGSLKEAWLQTSSSAERRARTGAWRPSYVAFLGPDLRSGRERAELRVMRNKLDKDPLVMVFKADTAVKLLPDVSLAFCVTNGEEAKDSDVQSIELAAYSRKELNSWLATLAIAFEVSKQGVSEAPTSPTAASAAENVSKQWGVSVAEAVINSSFWEVPTVLGKVDEYLREVVGKDPDALYAVFKHPGEQAHVQLLMEDIQNDIDLDFHTPHSACTLLVVFFRTMRDALFTKQTADQLLLVVGPEKRKRGRGIEGLDNKLLPEVGQVISTLGKEKQGVLLCLCSLLRLLVDTPQSGLSTHDLATIWAPVLFAGVFAHKIDEDIQIRNRQFIVELLVDHTADILPAHLFTEAKQPWPRFRKLDPLEMAAQLQVADLTLEDVLADPYGTNLLLRFGLENFRSENLTFVLACRQFAAAPTVEGCKKIYNECIRVGSDNQVNVSNELRQACADIVAQIGPDRPPNGSEFDAIVEEVRLLLNTNSFMSFKQLPYFEQWITKRVLQPESVPKPEDAQPQEQATFEDEGPPEPEKVWLKRQVPNDSHYYYIDIQTMETVWEKPATGKIWQRIKSDQGNYYHNVRERSTTWTTPPELLDLAKTLVTKRQKE